MVLIHNCLDFCIVHNKSTGCLLYRVPAHYTFIAQEAYIYQHIPWQLP